MKLRVLILSLNNLKYIIDCITDLLAQDTKEFKITIIDQGSTEFGVIEFLENLPNNIDVIFNGKNEPVNKMWNWFYENNDEELLCFLNNDVKLTTNFISDTIKVFNIEDSVGVVAHATNHPDYNIAKEELDYIIVQKYINMQGWDYTIRRKCFTKIPTSLKIYCGDDFLYHHIYKQGYNMAYVLSSPIIHFEGQSKKYMNTSGVEDIMEFTNLGYKHYLKINTNFSKLKPTYKNF